MNADDQTLQKAIQLAHPTHYKIHYRDLHGRTGCFSGEFDEAHKDIWLAYLKRPENALGVEYWAEPVLSKNEGAVKEQPAAYSTTWEK